MWLVLLLFLSTAYANVDLAGDNHVPNGMGRIGRPFFRPLPFYEHGPLINERETSNLFDEFYETRLYGASSRIDVSQWSPYFGKFISLDICQLVESTIADPISAPAGDFYFDLDHDGHGFVPYFKSEDGRGPTENYTVPLNHATAFLDLDPVYGTDENVSLSLRTLVGGELFLPNGFLPTAAQAPGIPYFNPLDRPASRMYVAGDVFVNENEPNILIHTLFAREHNRLAREQAALHPEWTDQEVFEAARLINIHQYQKIVFSSFMSSILGESLPPYEGYDSDEPADANLFFATIAWPSLNSALTGSFLFDISYSHDEDADSEKVFISRALRDTTFAPPPCAEDELGALALGLSDERVASVDANFVEDVRSFANGQPGRTGVDLFATALRRTRELGIPPASQVRESLGLPAYTSFADITSNEELAALLELMYGTVDKVEAFIGALCEDHEEGKRFGPLLMQSWSHYFSSLRRSDSQWFELVNSEEYLANIDDSALTQLLKKNFPGIEGYVKDFVMLPGASIPPPVPPPLDSFLESDYDFTVDLLEDQLRLSWKVWGDEFIQFAVHARTEGWIGVGFGAEQGMAGADILLGSIEDGHLVFDDYYADKNGAPILDSESGGHDNVLGAGGMEASGLTTLIFRRPFAAVEPQDKAVLLGVNRVCIAFGEEDKLTRHSPQSRGTVNIDLVTGEVTDVESAHAGIVMAHSILMGVAWVVISPVAILIHRYGWFLTRAQRRRIHVLLNVVVALATVVAVVSISVVLGGTPPDGAHPIMALRILVLPLVIVQVLLRFLPCLPAELVTKLHRALGVSLYIVGQIEVDIGMARSGLHYALNLFVILWQLAVIVLTVRLERHLWEYIGMPGLIQRFRSSKVAPSKTGRSSDAVEAYLETTKDAEEMVVSESAMIEAEQRRIQAEKDEEERKQAQLATDGKDMKKEAESVIPPGSVEDVD